MGLIEHFTEKGERWCRIAAEPIEQYIVGVDLGQSSDPTAVAVLHHHREPLQTWTTVKSPGGGGTIRQDAPDHFDVRFLQRLPLGMSYPAQVDHVAAVIARRPLLNNCELVIDETGVGRPVGDIFERAGLRPVRITITSGSEPQRLNDKCWHVPKLTLISNLDARLHMRELRFAAELTEAGAMADELKDFQRKVGVAGRYSYEARVGKHDDLVLAVAIALWAAVRPRSYARIGTYVL
jgi:hypothetical protein